MLEIKTVQGKTAILYDSKDVFNDLSVKTSDRDANTIAFTCSSSKKEEEMYYGETEQATVSIVPICDSDSVVFQISAKMKGTSPSFNRQSYFSADNGVEVSFSLLSAKKYMAVYQHKAWWTRPAFLKDCSEIPDKTQLLLWEEKGEYYVFMTACGKQCRADLKGSEGAILLSLSSNISSLNRIEETIAVLCCGKDPYLCCEKAVKQLIAHSGCEASSRQEKTYPEMFRYLGWCSWDAFYHKVDEKGLLEKFDEFEQKDIPVRWALIDDGWLDADYEKQKLIGFDAEKNKFPDGLKSTVGKLKQYAKLDYVGVWHSIMGYWNGIGQESPAAHQAEKYLQTLPDGRRIPSVNEGENFSFWNYWHSYLKQCGIDFVKVDGQSCVSIFHEEQKSYGDASRAVQRGLTASAAVNFGGNIIHCMGMAPQDTWNRNYSSIARSSDDFVPEVAHGFREHAIQNGYNSLLYGQLYWGDWDMFWSEHEENQQNSMLRAISGGPVYTSDPVGKTNPDYILPLILKDGKLLLCEDTGVPTADCLLCSPTEDEKPLKLFNRFKDSFLIAAFNISNKNQPIKGEISLSDIPAMQGEYRVFRFKNHSGHRLSSSTPIEFELEENGSEMFLCIPCQGGVTPVGLLGKYLSVATVERTLIEKDKTVIWLREGGSFGFFSTETPSCVSVNGEPTKFTKKDDLFIVDCKSASGGEVTCITIE